MQLYLIILTVVGSLLAAAIPVKGTDVWFSQFIGVALFGFLFIALQISKVNKSIALFFTYVVLNMVFVSHFNIMALIIMTMISLCAIIFYHVSNLYRFQRIVVCYTLAGILLFQVVWSIVQKFNLDPIFRLASNHHFCDVVGFSGSHNQFSLFLSMLSPLVFNNIFLLGFVILGIFLSTSFAGMLGVVGGFLFYYRKERLLIVGVVFIILCCLFLFLVHKDYRIKFNERLDLWKLTISQVIKGKAEMKVQQNITQIKTCNPLFGYGLGSFFQISPYTQEGIILKNSGGMHRYEHAHNDYIEILFDFGIVGIVLFIYCIFDLVKVLREVMWDEELNIFVSMVVCIGVCALSIYTIHTAYNGMLISVILGLLYGKIREVKGD